MNTTCDKNSINDCSICMEIINPELNCIITECGHYFHSRCLLTNVARNGFGCPNCRTKMIDENIVDNAENNAEENVQTGFFIDDEEYDVDSWQPSNDDDDDIEERNDYALRGMRMLFALNEGDDIEEEESTRDETLEHLPWDIQMLRRICTFTTVLRRIYTFATDEFISNYAINQHRYVEPITPFDRITNFIKLVLVSVGLAMELNSVNGIINCIKCLVVCVGLVMEFCLVAEIMKDIINQLKNHLSM